MVNKNRHGLGVESYPNGDKYEGQFYKDQIEGQGRYLSASGHKYVGEYKNGLKHGRGINKYPNGYKYEGSYEND